jgi:hypothetical protein
MDDFAFGYKLGYDYGIQSGWLRGRDDEREAWNQIIGVYADVVGHPLHADLEAIRQPSNDPCAAKCGRCSRCARSQAVWARRRAGAPDDYPGGRVRWAA